LAAQTPQDSPQTEPQEAPLPAQVSVQSAASMHTLAGPQTSPPVQEPHRPPHPSSPQVLPSQLRAHSHWKSAQAVPAAQAPHSTPQTEPHAALMLSQVSVQSAASRQAPARSQTMPAAQMPQEPPQPSSPHTSVSQSGTHTPPPPPVAWQIPAAEHVLSASQIPHTLPQPSSPQSRASQAGVHVPLLSGSPSPLSQPVSANKTVQIAARSRHLT